MEEGAQVTGPDPLPPWPRPPGAVVAVGLFDCVHRGHAFLLETLKAWAAERGAAPVAVTFDPHPEEILSGAAPPLVASPARRVELIRALGVSRVWLFPLTRGVMALTAREFAARYVRGALGGQGLLMGFDNRLGSDRADCAALGAAAAGLGIEVRVCPPYLVEGEPVSSTAVRKAIIAGDLAAAERLLGRRVSVMGRVVRGRRIGRLLGFPTANLQTAGLAVVPCGIYAAEVTLEGRTLRAAMSVGSGPTARPADIAPGTGPYAAAEHTVEVHIIGYDGDLTGKEIEARVVRKLREERRFPDYATLVAQIKKDIAAIETGAEPGEAT